MCTQLLIKTHAFLNQKHKVHSPVWYDKRPVCLAALLSVHKLSKLKAPQSWSQAHHMARGAEKYNALHREVAKLSTGAGWVRQRIEIFAQIWPLKPGRNTPSLCNWHSGHILSCLYRGYVLVPIACSSRHWRPITVTLHLYNFSSRQPNSSLGKLNVSQLAFQSCSASDSTEEWILQPALTAIH